MFHLCVPCVIFELREVEQAVYLGWWFDPQFLRSASRRFLGQDTEPQNAPDGCSIGV